MDLPGVRTAPTPIRQGWGAGSVVPVVVVVQGVPRGNRQPPYSQAAICSPLRGAYSPGRWDSAALGTSRPDPAILRAACGAEHRPWPLPLPRRQPALGKEPGRGKCLLGSGWKGVQGMGGAGHRKQLLLGIGAGSSAGLMGQQRCSSPCSRRMESGASCAPSL